VLLTAAVLYGVAGGPSPCGSRADLLGPGHLDRPRQAARQAVRHVAAGLAPACLADLAGPGGMPEDLHDLRCRRGRAGRVQLLLLPQPGDPLLERVVGGGEPLGLAPVAGGAVGAGQLVQPLELGRRR
jgi:hypothetical protein